MLKVDNKTRCDWLYKFIIQLNSITYIGLATWAIPPPFRQRSVVRFLQNWWAVVGVGGRDSIRLRMHQTKALEMTILFAHQNWPKCWRYLPILESWLCHWLPDMQCQWSKFINFNQLLVLMNWVSFYIVVSAASYYWILLSSEIHSSIRWSWWWHCTIKFILCSITSLAMINQIQRGQHFTT